MKKLFCLLLLPVFALIMLSGCGSDKTILDVKEAYAEMISTFQVEEKNILFSDNVNRNSISISYPSSLKSAINIENPSNNVQKRFRALHYQQKVLDNIFIYYENHNADFYLNAQNIGYDADKINELYDSIISLKHVLEDFKSNYEIFINSAQNISNVMEFNITTYSYHLNLVINESFKFIDKFHNLYLSFLENYSEYDEKNLNVYVDKAYIDMARIVFLENMKSFNDSVGSNGVCDLSGIIGNESKFNYIYMLDEERGKIKLSIQENAGLDSEIGKEATDQLNHFRYISDVFNQRFENYQKIYNGQDMYKVNQYRFNLNSSVDYESYLNSLSAADRATIVMLDGFVNDNFTNYMKKLKEIIEVR